jgi:nucleotide-binding universal stress UspA family protein
MFKNILVPTDGSELARKAIDAAIRFAADVGAKVTGVHVFNPTQAMAMSDAMSHEGWRRIEARAKEERAAADAYLQEISQAAAAADVPCTTCAEEESGSIADGILKAASKAGCDAIFIASHGRSGAKAFFLGSQTNAVIDHSKIPVLVFR